MLRMPSLLESRSDLLHLWTSLGWKRIQPQFYSMATGCSLNSALRHQEGETPRCSARQNRRTERAFCGAQRAGDMYQKRVMMEFTIASNETKSIVNRNSKLAGPSKSASKWTSWHRKTTPTVYPEMNSRYFQNIGISHYQIGQECTNATSIRLPSRSHNHEPSPPRIRRRRCRTYSFSTVSKMAPFFLNSFLVELGHVQKLVELMSSIHFLKLLQQFSLTADGDLL